MPEYSDSLGKFIRKILKNDGNSKLSVSQSVGVIWKQHSMLSALNKVNLCDVGKSFAAVLRTFNYQKTFNKTICFNGCF